MKLKMNKTVLFALSLLAFAASITLMVIGGTQYDRYGDLWLGSVALCEIAASVILMFIAFAVLPMPRRKFGSIPRWQLGVALVLIGGIAYTSTILTQNIPFPADQYGCCELGKIVQRGLPVVFTTGYYSDGPNMPIVDSSTSSNGIIWDSIVWAAVYAYISYAALAILRINRRKSTK